VDKDEYFLQMKQKVDLLKQEKRRLQIENERTVKENVDMNNHKQRIVDSTKEIIEDIKSSNDNLVKMLEDKQTECDNIRQDLTEKNMHVSKLKEKVIEMQKLEQKYKMLENKYVYDMGQSKLNHDKHSKNLNTELN
jgi:hypothetical protein